MAYAPPPARPVVRFGTFEVNLRSGELRRAGVRVSLQDQPFRVLEMLLAGQGEVVTREQLRQALWPAATFVDFEHGLNAAVKRLRDALGDAADAPRFIETLPKRGYRFIAPVDGGWKGTSTAAPDDPSPGRRSRWRRWTVGFGISAAIVTSLFIFQRLLAPPPALTARDTLLLADWVNATGDPLFEPTLKRATAVKLGETPFLQLVSDELVRDALSLMRRDQNEPVTGLLAREVCERVGAKALVAGHIAALGNHFVVDLEAVECRTGEALARAQAEAASKEEVMRALDRATSQVRRKLGESLASIEARNTPLERATTASLEAWKAFSEGEARFMQDRQFEAIPFYRRAIELDPNFAMAHAKMGVVYGNKGEVTLHAEHLSRAFDLRDQVGERERLYITGHYYRLVKGEMEKSREVYEVWKSAYPRDASPLNSLALMDVRRGERDRALAGFQAAVRVDPRTFFYGNLAAMYINLNRLADARATLDEADTRAGVDPARHAEQRFTIAFLEGDQEGMRRHVAAARGSQNEAVLVRYHAQAAASFGRLTDAHELFRRATELTARLTLDEVGAFIVGIAALWDAEVGHCARMAERVRVPAASRTLPVGAYGTALAQCSEAAQARALLGDLEKRSAGGPQLRARLEIRQGNGGKALELLGPRGPGDLRSPLNPEAGLQSGLAIVYARGLAWLAAGQGDRAVEEFQVIVDNPGIAPLAPYHALAPLYLARAHALTGDGDTARDWYGRFFERWKNADPDVPILIQARTEFARLTAH